MLLINVRGWCAYPRILFCLADQVRTNDNFLFRSYLFQIFITLFRNLLLQSADHRVKATTKHFSANEFLTVVAWIMLFGELTDILVGLLLLLDDNVLVELHKHLTLEP